MKSSLSTSAISKMPRRRTPPGSPPGTLIPDPRAITPVLTVIAFGPHGKQEMSGEDLTTLSGLRDEYDVVWVDIQGLADVGLLEQLGEIFGLHDLALEDVINVHQRAKVEEYDDHAFIVCRMPTSASEPTTEQVSLFLGEGYVLTFQERCGDCFEGVRQRIQNNRGRVRRSSADYLVYTLIDAVTDAYFPLLEHFGERVESLEEQVTTDGGRLQAAHIHAIKRDLLLLRRAVWPLREAVNALLRDETPYVSAQTRVYFRDCYDHTAQLMDMIETYREVASGLIDIHLSRVSMRMNEIMKVLTVIATIFIPLSFIAGVYGMNFDRSLSPWNMPELAWYFGYPFALAIMLAVALALVCYFWRKGWLGSG